MNLAKPQATAPEVMPPRADRATTARDCSRCGSVAITGERLRGLLGLLTGQSERVRLYRCLDCGHRALGLRRR
jgi:transposase